MPWCPRRCARPGKEIARGSDGTRFFNEARAVNRIAHPSIVQIHEHGRLPDGTAYIVMEYLDGQPLNQRLRQLGGRMPPRTALQIAWQVAAALSAAHGKGIVHRDLKPGNLMLVPDPLGPGGERVKVLDFGIAKLVVDLRPGNTASHIMMGTPTYMSPENRTLSLSEGSFGLVRSGGLFWDSLGRAEALQLGSR